jgi:hypothetical protein
VVPGFVVPLPGLRPCASRLRDQRYIISISILSSIYRPELALMSSPRVLDAEFLRDDLHFCTLTTLLYLFSRPDRSRCDSKVAPGLRSNPKSMMGLSTILSRGPEEVVACMAKRSIDNIALFCIPEKKRTTKRAMTSW